MRHRWLTGKPKSIAFGENREVLGPRFYLSWLKRWGVSRSLIATDLAGLSGVLLPASTKFTLIAYSGAWNGGTFAAQPNGSVVQIGPNGFVLKYDATVRGINFQSEVGDGLHYVTLTAVPEPSITVLSLVGISVLAGGRRRPTSHNRA